MANGRAEPQVWGKIAAYDIQSMIGARSLQSVSNYRILWVTLDCAKFIF